MSNTMILPVIQETIKIRMETIKSGSIEIYYWNLNIYSERLKLALVGDLIVLF